MNLKKLAENLLFALNIYIAFIALFNNSLYVPNWLLPVGRLHPVVLHFPIVLLILTLISVFFRLRNEQHRQIQYHISSYLLLLAALFSAITVITGLFLSREEGYEGNTLTRHMWTGIAIVFVASFIYRIRNWLWKKVRFYKIISICSIFLVAATGHYGATLTHGEGFLLPRKEKEKQVVAFEDALVFDHVILPVVRDKCASCHNPRKAKGSLVLQDSASFVKGGKTGKLFVPGQPEISLLLERIHLPDDDDKRMPPPGKPELTGQEMELLELWIRGGAGFSAKLAALAPGDSLRELAGTFLDTQEPFDFPAAKEETVQQLTNNDRLISKLSRESPALAVKMYNSVAYTKEKLEELLVLKTQVVSLDLNKLPVKDDDLKIIARFQNLRRLNLNFTDITGAGLMELNALKHLRNLYLSGAKVNYNGLKSLQAMPKLQQLAIWSNPLTEAELETLQKENPKITFITGYRDDGIPSKLIPPRLAENTVVFNDTLPLALEHPIYGVDIRYTTDGSDPDSILSPLMQKGAFISQNTTVKAKAYKDGWLSSDVSAFTFFKNEHKPDSMYFLAEPFENYRGDGVYTFFDGELGGMNIYRYTKNKWVGFRNGNLELMFLYNDPAVVQSVGLHTYISSGEQAFPPEHIEVWGGANERDMKLLASIKPLMPQEKDEREVKIINVGFKPEKVACLKVVAKPLMKQPPWSRGKGEPAMLMIDEILVN
ncbi:MAG: chitobiase/beta-hexosaminidase C-terminal domain-containing protein [Chitinophagaceae bacterium]|nr:chitobiase/beta-hexosaminidase C-terminal domain-containing protein [Chitinophagaceae bacterium]